MFYGVGIGAFMGWIPTSSKNRSDTAFAADATKQTLITQTTQQTSQADVVGKVESGLRAQDAA